MCVSSTPWQQAISAATPRNVLTSLSVLLSQRAPTKNASDATGMELSRSTAKAKRACADKGYGAGRAALRL